MRKLRIFSSLLVVVFFISFFSFSPGCGHFIQLGSEAWGEPINSTVVSSAYDTSGNNGRKLVSLADGKIAAISLKKDIGLFYLHISSDNGKTWTTENFCGATVPINGFAVTTDGIFVYLLANFGDSGCVCCFKLTISNGVFVGCISTTIDTNQTAGGACSITCDSLCNLYAVWCSKNSVYPNSSNIRFAKSTNGGITWTKVDGTAGVDQVTTVNTSGTDLANPCVIIMSNGYPNIISQYYTSGSYYLYAWRWTGTVFNTAQIYSISSYAQYSPCAVVAPNGRIWVVWHGKDSVDSTYDNIRCKYSDDNGTNWSNGGVVNEKITFTLGSYNQCNPSIACDKNNSVHIVWNGALVSSSNNMNIRQIVRIGSTWGSIVEVTNQSAADILYPSICANYINFSKPLFIYQDNQAGAVKFSCDIGQPPIITTQTPTQNAALFQTFAQLKGVHNYEKI